MRVSLNWLKEFLNLDLSNQEISDKLTQVGLESTYNNFGKNFSGIVLGRVLTCNPHPNADKLSVCTVDIGNSKIYQIVCGAPNVKSNIYVPVAIIGAELNNGDFKIKKTKIRGVVSNGMICSGRELAFNDDHEGILILETKQKLGTPIEQILDFSDDVNFNLDLTPNRGDCLSHLGVARELGIITKQNISRKEFDLKEDAGNIDDIISVNINVPDACPRYVTRIVKDLKVGPSPKWLIERLESIGFKSINNVVDSANYVLMNTGHPMHTFDLHKIAGDTINVRFANKGEKFITLDNVERKLDDFHLLICDKKNPVALAGIMGGLNSEITTTTTDVLIESAYFDPTVIRKGAKKMDLSTEASRRFERDTDIEAIIPAIDELAHLLHIVAGGTIVKGIIDEYPKKINKHPITFSMNKCNSLLGINLKEEEFDEIFKLLQISVKKNQETFLCSIPSFRNDLTREVDLCEEVARIIGYDNIPLANKFSGSFISFVDDEQELDTSIRYQLKSIGFHEHYSNSLMGEEFTTHFTAGKAVKIKNPLSNEMVFIRNSILPGLLKAASYNEKRKQRNFTLFEIGAVHNHSNKSYTNTKEKLHLGILWSGDPEMHWRHYENRDIFRCKGEINQFLNSIGINNIQFKSGKSKGLAMVLKVYHNKMQLGVVGILDQELLHYYDINQAPIICDISIMDLRELKKNNKFNYESPSQYPSISRDIALQVNKNISSEDLFNTIGKEGGNLLKDISLFDLYQSEDVGDENKSLAFSLKFQSNNSTLTDAEVDPMIDKIITSLHKSHGAIQR